MNTLGALIPEAWESLLPASDVDFNYILTGVREGFMITTEECSGPRRKQRNYKSALCGENREAVEKQIRCELANGRYVTTSAQPYIISALGAIPKPDSNKVRLIHDCSQPVGGALNELVSNRDKLSFQSIKDATAIINEGDYMGKIDLTSAYRSVRLPPSQHHLTGLEWHFKGEAVPRIMYDSRLPFGATLSVSVFHRLSQAVRRIMAARGHHKVVAYVDDFLCIGDTQEECNKTMTELRLVLRRLGFAINYNYKWKDRLSA